MNELLTNLIGQQKNEVPCLLARATVERDCLGEFTASLSSPLIKVIIGPRRSGKSTLALHALRDKKFAYFNFEDEQLNFPFTANDLLESFDVVYPSYDYILLDEIQLLPQWEKYLNRLERLQKNVIVTGSNSKLLSSELATSLTGRHLSYELLPFSFAEYQRATHSGTYVQYLSNGGFPSVALQNTTLRDFLTALWDSIILKDIVHRYKIRRAAELKNLLFVVLTMMCGRTSGRSLERALHANLNHSTINKFLQYAEQAYLCILLQNYSFKSRVRVSAEKKVYLYDNGFFTAHHTGTTPDHGKLLENAVFIALCRKGLKPNNTLYHYRTKADYEVDFYATPSSGESALYQVAFSVEAPHTLERETRALLAAADELRVNKLYIITMEDAERELHYGSRIIHVVPASKL